MRRIRTRWRTNFLALDFISLPQRQLCHRLRHRIFAVCSLLYLCYFFAILTSARALLLVKKKMKKRERAGRETDDYDERMKSDSPTNSGVNRRMLVCTPCHLTDVRTPSSSSSSSSPSFFSFFFISSMSLEYSLLVLMFVNSQWMRSFLTDDSLEIYFSLLLARVVCANDNRRQTIGTQRIPTERKAWSIEKMSSLSWLSPWHRTGGVKSQKLLSSDENQALPRWLTLIKLIASCDASIPIMWADALPNMKTRAGLGNETLLKPSSSRNINEAERKRMPSSLTHIEELYF